MKTLARLLTVLVLGAIPRTALAKGPVVVELFTAQGCASCKQANGLIARLADRPGVVALTWAVDYWDYLGWKDTFARPESTARQQAFVRRLGPRDVYTPQVVVNGASQVSGGDTAGVEALITRADHLRRDPPKVRFVATGAVRIGAGHPPRGGPCEVWLVRYDPTDEHVMVTAGDNRGETVTLRNVVRQSVKLGSWTGRAASYRTPPPPESGLGSVVIVQRPRGGAILAAAEYRPR